MLQIQNEQLTAAFSALGGEPCSLKGTDGTEYLWQGNPTYWKGRAPHLFPIVGRLTDGQYTLDGKTYEMEAHGFFRRREMRVDAQTPDSVTLVMESGADTLRQYPRAFCAGLCYRLYCATLHIRFWVENRDEKPLYFTYGGHPGFHVPLAPGLAFEDYYLQFEAGAAPLRVGKSSARFLQGPDTPFALETGNRLPLRHALFDNDAITLKNAGQSLRLESPKDSRAVRVDFAGMPYLSLWHTPKTSAPYLCIEPWYGLPSRQGVVEALEEKPGMLCLAPGKSWQTKWSITCG